MVMVMVMVSMVVMGMTTVAVLATVVPNVSSFRRW